MLIQCWPTVFNNESALGWRYVLVGSVRWGILSWSTQGYQSLLDQTASRCVSTREALTATRKNNVTSNLLLSVQLLVYEIRIFSVILVCDLLHR